MTRVYVVVEGPTEESFVNGVLAPALWPQQVYVHPIIIGSPGHKGGNPKYARLKKDVLKQLKQDRSAHCSTILDFYGLGADFPGMPLPANLPNLNKVFRIEQAIKADILAQLPDLRPEVRFLPYLQLHEYEALLFSDPEFLLLESGSHTSRSSSRESAIYSIRPRTSTTIPIRPRPNGCSLPTQPIAKCWMGR